MRNDAERLGCAARGGAGAGGGMFSLRSLSGYMRVVSSGASTVASTVRSAGASVASSIANAEGDDSRDQVHWAGFDRLECEGDILRQVLLLGYRSGFQVWDVEEGDDVRLLVASNVGSVSFLQMLKKPIASERCEDPFADARPLLVIAADGSFSSSGKSSAVGYGGGSNHQELVNDRLPPTSLHFYSLRTHENVHVLKFRSPVYSIRCTPRVVAVSQAAQVHCFSASSLVKEYTILTCPIVSVSLVSGGIGCGPLALGSRWLAYSGSPVAISSDDRVSPELLAPASGLSPSLPNGSLVAHYAKESSKQLAAGLVTLGDMGYKKLSKYLPDNSSSMKHGISSFKTNGTINEHLVNADSIGMVIVRDVVSKSVLVQFRAHKSPISALVFDPSGTLLVTASVQGHNINVFRIMPSPPGCSSGSDGTGACIHLYRLQRGITNAIIQDISFSDDSQWIMISSSRGTSHLFSISLSGGNGDLQRNDVNFVNASYGSDLTATTVCCSHNSGLSKLDHQRFLPSGSPITLSVVSRIKNGSNGWKGAVSGAAAAATGRASPLTGAIASAFHNCKSFDCHPDISSLRANYYLLVFSPSGCIIQYVLRHSTGQDSGVDLSGFGTVSHGSMHGIESKLVVEPLQKWDVCQKFNRRGRGHSVDVYGEHGYGESNKLYQKGMKRGTSIYPSDRGANMKVKLNAEENNHMYISEVELHTHRAHMPLWANLKIHFEVMVDENLTMENSSSLGGEVEIERVPTHTIEARTKDLIPVFDYVLPPLFEQSRANCSDSNITGLLLHRKFGLSEDGGLSCRSSCSSLDCVPDSIIVTENSNGFSENCRDALQSTADSNRGFVNSGLGCKNLKSQLEFVNNREECLDMETQFNHVNNKESLEGAYFSDNDTATS